jgi:hypothetical protein
MARPWFSDSSPCDAGSEAAMQPERRLVADSTIAKETRFAFMRVPP